MKLEHSFTVPAPVEQVWSTLLDIEGVAPCLPGATLTGTDGEEFAGTVKVKLGAVSLTYAGKGRFLERDDEAHRVVIDANGRDKNGNGTAGATVHARMEPDGGAATKVVVETDLKVTGRPAQFGRACHPGHRRAHHRPVRRLPRRDDGPRGVDGGRRRGGRR